VHDVLDARDLVPDEAEQLRLSGYPVGELETHARAAADRGDLPRLAEIELTLAQLPRDPGWPYHEPEDEPTLVSHSRALSPRPVEDDRLAARLQGAWLGRAVGNTLGKPVEGLTRQEVERYLRAAGQWPQRGYLPLLDPLPDGVARLHPSAPVATAGNFTDVPRDDDIDWTILGLHLLERYGSSFTTDDIAREWLDRIPFSQTYTAERAAYRNLAGGVRPPETATVRNPYREWIGALIRADAFGYVAPGDPGRAARLAMRDARLTHTANGVYGEMWAAGLVAAALAADDVQDAFGQALQLVPGRSRLAATLREVSEIRRRRATVSEALDWVDLTLSHYPWVHTINNAALIAIGLLWGRDFLDAVGIAISGGRDTDSTAATVGSVYGALHGAQAVPAELGQVDVQVRSAVRDFDRVTIRELARRTLDVARRLDADHHG
jgi:ADP-ribosylglycohydrolase